MYKFTNALNESIEDDTFPSKYNSLNHSSSFEEKNNTLNSYDNLDESNNILKNAQSSDSVDYIGDSVNEDNCNDEQQLYTLEHDNHDEKQGDTLICEDDNENYHGILKHISKIKYKPIMKNALSHFNNFINALDAKFEAEMINLIKSQYKTFLDYRNNLSKTIILYLKVFTPLFASALFIFVSLGFHSRPGFIISYLLFESTIMYMMYKFSKCINTFKNTENFK